MNNLYLCKLPETACATTEANSSRYNGTLKLPETASRLRPRNHAQRFEFHSISQYMGSWRMRQKPSRSYNRNAGLDVRTWSRTGFDTPAASSNKRLIRYVPMPKSR